MIRLDAICKQHGDVACSRAASGRFRPTHFALGGDVLPAPEPLGVEVVRRVPLIPD